MSEFGDCTPNPSRNLNPLNKFGVAASPEAAAGVVVVADDDSVWATHSPSFDMMLYNPGGCTDTRAVGTGKELCFSDGLSMHRRLAPRGKQARHSHKQVHGQLVQQYVFGQGFLDSFWSGVSELAALVLDDDCLTKCGGYSTAAGIAGAWTSYCCSFLALGILSRQQRAEGGAFAY